MKMLKNWLGLTRSTSVAVLHHPDVIGVPHLPQLQTKAKLTFLASIDSSADPLIQELTKYCLSEPTVVRLGISEAAGSLFLEARDSISSITRRTLQQACGIVVRGSDRDHWDDHLNNLTVQNKFKSICQLESDNHVWDRIQRGLPPGQLSFLLRAGSDTLPTPLNLKRWNLRVDSKCHLCGSSTPTVFHILNGCPVALDQARYTWRHDSVLWRFDKAIRSHMLEGDHLYSDISGLRAHENPQSTVPHDLTITTARPDMVYMSGNSVILVELTVPSNSYEHLCNAQNRKRQKPLYQLLLSELDSLGKQASLVTIEIGSLGHWIPKCCQDFAQSFSSFFDKSSARKLFDSAARTAISASQIIFLARKSDHWLKDKPLLI